MPNFADSDHSSTERKKVHFYYDGKRTNIALMIKEFIIAHHVASVKNKAYCQLYYKTIALDNSIKELANQLLMGLMAEHIFRQCMNNTHLNLKVKMRAIMSSNKTLQVKTLKYSKLNIFCEKM